MIHKDVISTLPSKAAQLVELLADFQPRTKKQIRQSFQITSLSSVAQRANEALKPHGLEIQTQLHPRQSNWFWLMVELGGEDYAG